MTSIPASRSARAMIFAPRSCPSRPGFATTTLILPPVMRRSLRALVRSDARRRLPRAGEPAPSDIAKAEREGGRSDLRPRTGDERHANLRAVGERVDDVQHHV